MAWMKLVMSRIPTSADRAPPCGRDLPPRTPWSGLEGHPSRRSAPPEPGPSSIARARAGSGGRHGGLSAGGEVARFSPLRLGLRFAPRLSMLTAQQDSESSGGSLCFRPTNSQLARAIRHPA